MTSVTKKIFISISLHSVHYFFFESKKSFSVASKVCTHPCFFFLKRYPESMKLVVNILLT